MLKILLFRFKSLKFSVIFFLDKIDKSKVNKLLLVFE